MKICMFKVIKKVIEINGIDTFCHTFCHRNYNKPKTPKKWTAKSIITT